MAVGKFQGTFEFRKLCITRTRTFASFSLRSDNYSLGNYNRHKFRNNLDNENVIKSDKAWVIIAVIKSDKAWVIIAVIRSDIA